MRLRAFGAAIWNGLRAGLRVGRWTLDNPPGWLTSGSGVSGRLNMPELTKPAESVLWAFACLRARADAISQVPLRIGDEEGNVIEEGALFELLERPNQWQDGVKFLADVESYLTMYESAYIVPVAESGAQPDELVSLPAANVDPIAGVHGPTGREIVMGWKYRNPNSHEERSFTFEEVISMVSPNPYNPLRAIAPTGPLRRTIQMHVATMEQNLALFLHGGVPDIVLSTEQRWNKDQVKEFMQRWVDNYAGYSNAHKPALLDGGLKAEKLGFNPAEMQSTEVLRTLTPQEIVAGFRCKPVMVGLMHGETGLSQGSSTEEQKVAWWSEVGLAELARIAAALQIFLVDRYDWTKSPVRRRAMTRLEVRAFARQRRQMRPYAGPTIAGGDRKWTLWFDTNAIPELVEHRLARLDHMGKLLDRGWKPDEVVEYLDLALPDHPTNQGLVPFSLQPVEDVAPGLVEEEEPEPAEAEGDGRDARATLDAIGRLEAALRAEGGEDVIPRKWRPTRKVLDALLKPLEKEAANKWGRFFIEQRKRVRERFAGLREARAEQAARQETAGEVLAEIFPREGEDKALGARLGPLWAHHLKAGWEYFHEHEKPPGAPENPFEVKDGRVLAALDRRRIQGAKVNATTEDALREILREGFKEGATLIEVGDAIDGYYKEHAAGAGSYRAQTAARTQTAGIVNDGRLLAAEEVGGLKKGWLHGGSKEARPSHLAAQAKYLNEPIGLSEKFTLESGQSCDAPGDADLTVDETANCSCMVVFVPED